MSALHSSHDVSVYPSAGLCSSGVCGSAASVGTASSVTRTAASAAMMPASHWLRGLLFNRAASTPTDHTPMPTYITASAARSHCCSPSCVADDIW